METADTGTSPVSDIVSLLAGITRPGAFAVRTSLPPEALRLEVRGVGRVPLPVTKSRARRLRAVARPARYGLRERTVLDKRVRDAWEIPKSRVKIDRRRWNEVLRPELDRIRHRLGLPEGCKLKAELHNLLLYEPGQFFAPHQDSEKGDAMIGSLVVTLPSATKGGALVIEHHDEKVTVRGSERKLTLAAFYADCHHEVRPVREGHRIALTYNLFLEGDPLPPAPQAQVEALARGIQAFFETPPRPRWQRDAPRTPPERLVYLLDHQYTQRSLGWERLKNADAARAAALREVARRLDCEVFLALADVHEMWSCEEVGYGYGRARRYRGFRVDFDGEEDPDAPDEPALPELIDLEDYDVELRSWVDADGKQRSVSSAVAADEICYTKPSIELAPFRSEHEPYMGNWGNTVDRWYHRAAVVMWPREHAFRIRARASASWAIGEMGKALRRNARADARRMAEAVAPFWASAAAVERTPGLLARTLRVAAGLDAPAPAAVLLRPFAFEQLTPKAAPQLASLLERYGLDWCCALLAEWDSTRARGAREAWLEGLPAICHGLCASGARDGVELARRLAAGQWSWLQGETRATAAHAPPSRLLRELAGLHPATLALLESTRTTGDTQLHASILHALTRPEVRGPVLNLARLLRTAAETRSAQPLRALGLSPLRARCVEELAALLARPPRAQDDWSTELPETCSCELCTRLRAFLAAPGETRLEWPLAKEKRRHIHGILDRHELPVSHTTRRSGRPFTLVLAKTRALFEREESEREAWQRELNWLEGKRRAFGHAPERKG